MYSKKVIKCLQEKDKKTFEDIYNSYYKLVFYIIYSKVNDYEDAKDLAQDTFVSLMENITNIDPKKNLKYYIITIAKNLSIKYLNDKNHYVNDEDIINNKILEDSNNKYIKYDQMINVITLKCKLSKEEVEILVYKTKFDLKFREIASLYNQTTFQISSKYKRMMDKIKRTMKEDDFYE